MLVSKFLHPMLCNVQDRRKEQLQRQNELNALHGAARTSATAVELKGKLRPLRNDIVKMIDRRLCQLGMYEKLCLNQLFIGARCWQKYKAIKNMLIGLPSGYIEHWTWMPGGGRAGLATHVIWKFPRSSNERDLQKTITLQNQCVAKQTI